MDYNRIYTTTDYSAFDWVEINREVDKGKVKVLEKDIRNGIGVFTPILVNPEKVNGKIQIADGQHRFCALKNQRRPIRYIFALRQMELDDITLLNSRQTPWKPMDYVRAYATAGRQHYKQLLNFYDEVNERVENSHNLRQLSIRSVGYLTQDNLSNHSDGNKSIKSGGWEFRNTLEEARENLEIFMSFEQFGCSFNESFMQVVLNLIRNEAEFDVNRLIRQAKKYPYKFYNCSRSIDWQRMVEEVYNHGRGTANRIYFRYV
jgi:hypothetical protein